MTGGWLKAERSGVRWLAAAAVVLLALAAVGYWYTQRLPVADIETLTSAAAELDDVEDAYRRLRGLPGFAAARRRAVARRARPPEPRRDDVRGGHGGRHALAVVAGSNGPADRLLGEFWLRRAREQAHAEQRDAAILLAQRAAALPGAPPAAVAYLTELVGDDYARLERSLRLGSSPEYWHMGFARGRARDDRRGPASIAHTVRCDRHGRARRRAHRAYGARARRAGARA